jgi:hypothetical protein
MSEEAAKVETEMLVDCVHELYKLSEMLQEAIDKESCLPYDVAFVLTRTAIKRLEYYQEKYDFQVNREDDFLVEDLHKFLDLERLGKEKVS